MRKARREHIAALVRGAESRYRRALRQVGRAPLGEQRILAQSPLARPKNPSQAIRTRGFEPNEEAEKEYLAAIKIIRDAYKAVFHTYREAVVARRRLRALEWPACCYPPSCWTLAA